MADIDIDTDFARITVMSKKDHQTRDGLLEHARNNSLPAKASY